MHAVRDVSQQLPYGEDVDHRSERGEKSAKEYDRDSRQDAKYPMLSVAMAREEDHAHRPYEERRNHCHDEAKMIEMTFQGLRTDVLAKVRHEILGAEWNVRGEQERMTRIPREDQQSDA